MQTSLAAQIAHYKTGANIPIESMLVLWHEHCLFHEHQQRYDHAWEEAKALMDKTPIIVTDRFVIVESVTVPTILVPVIVRMLNLIHKGNKIIATLSTVMFEPELNELSKRKMHSLLQSEYIYSKEKNFTTFQHLGYVLRLMWYTMSANIPYTDPTDRMYHYLADKATAPKPVKKKKEKEFIENKINPIVHQPLGHSKGYNPMSFRLIE